MKAGAFFEVHTPPPAHPRLKTTGDPQLLIFGLLYPDTEVFPLSKPRKQLRVNKTKSAPKSAPPPLFPLLHMAAPHTQVLKLKLSGVTLHSHTLHKTSHQVTPRSAVNPPTCVIPAATTSAEATRPSHWPGTSPVSLKGCQVHFPHSHCSFERNSHQDTFRCETVLRINSARWPKDRASPSPGTC